MKSKACKQKSDIGTTKMRLMDKYLREGKRDRIDTEERLRS